MGRGWGGGGGGKVILMSNPTLIWVVVVATIPQLPSFTGCYCSDPRRWVKLLCAPKFCPQSISTPMMRWAMVWYNTRDLDLATQELYYTEPGQTAQVEVVVCVDGVETTLVFVDHPGGNTEVRPAVLKYQFSTSFSPGGSNINFLVLSKGRNSDEIQKMSRLFLNMLPF